MPTRDDELLAQVNTLGTKLQDRTRKAHKLDLYYDGSPPFPAAVVRARLTNAYRLLMPMASAPWGSVPVDSALDLLEVTGIQDPDDKDAAEMVWRDVWQANGMDAESKLGNSSALLHGRSYATVWPEQGGPPQVTLDSAEQMIIQYAEGSRRRRVAALRYWIDGRIPKATLYRPEAIYKFEGPKDSSGFHGTQWTRREEPNEPWPLPNPLGVLPNVERRVNGRLKPGPWPYARGEFEHLLGLLDRINLLTFLGLIVALWMGFPLRGVIGDKIVRDDDGNPLPPFDVDADAIVQLENPQAKFDQYDAADRRNLSIFDELAQFAYLTKTPAHHFPMSGGISNISADAIRALQGAEQAKIAGHKASLGEADLELVRIGGLMLETPVKLSPRARMLWKDSEFRSIAEAGDFAAKLNGILPWQVIAQKALNATQDEIRQWSTMRSSDALSTLINAATSPPAPAPNGAAG